MNFRKSLAFFSLASLLLISGCWDYINIEELSLPHITAYDVAHLLRDQNVNEANVNVTLLFPDLSLSSNRLYIERTAAATIGDARNKRALNSSSNVVFQGAQILLIGEQLAKSGVNIDILLRQPTVKNSMAVAVVKGRADNFLEQGVKSNTELGQTVFGLLTNTPEDTFIPKTTLHDMYLAQATPGKNLIAPLIELRGDEHPRILGIAIFNKDRLIAHVGERGSRALMLLRGIKTRGNIEFKMYEEGKLIDRGTVLMSNKRKVKVSRKEGKYHFDITITLKGDLVEHYNIKDFEEMIKYNQKIEQALEEQIANECQEFLNQMQREFKVDCIDISKCALAKWRKELEKTVNNEEFITNAEFEVKVKVDLNNIGERT